MLICIFTNRGALNLQPSPFSWSSWTISWVVLYIFSWRGCWKWISLIFAITFRFFPWSALSCSDTLTSTNCISYQLIPSQKHIPQLTHRAARDFDPHPKNCLYSFTATFQKFTGKRSSASPTQEFPLMSRLSPPSFRHLAKSPKLGVIAEGSFLVGRRAHVPLPSCSSVLELTSRSLLNSQRARMNKHFAEISPKEAENEVPKSLHTPKAHRDAAGHTNTPPRNTFN